jgi:DNA end-binding protein Ku
MATKTRKKTGKKKDVQETEAEKPGRLGRPQWSGSISFGLVNIPIRLYAATRNKDVRFHLLHEKDKSRLQEKLYCPTDEEEVSRQDVVKGYEISKNQHIVVSQEEISSLAPKATHAIELMNVVDIQQIDPMYFDRPLYVIAEERAGKAYYLLLEALRSAKKGAVAKFVMRNKEHIGVLRPIKNVLCLEIMHFADEIIPVSELGVSTENPGIRDAEVKMALQLLESLESDFKPQELHDDYREALLKLIQKKAEGQEIVTQPETHEDEPEVIDLMTALKKSVAQAQQRQKNTKAA